MSSPDPVKEAQAYQQMLLDAAAAAGDDPAEVQERAIAELGEMLALGTEKLDLRKAADEWTVLGIAMHIVNAEMVMTGRYRWALAENNPAIVGYDQDLWVDALMPLESDPRALLDLFTALRRANLALWRASSEAQRARAVMHAERGPESFEMMFRMIAGHDRVHLAQIRETLENPS